MNELEKNISNNNNNNDFNTYAILLILWNRRLLISIVVVLITTVTFVFSFTFNKNTKQTYSCEFFLESPYVVTAISMPGERVIKTKDVFISSKNIQPELEAYIALDAYNEIKSFSVENIKDDTIKITVELSDVSIIENLASDMLASVNQSKTLAATRDQLLVSLDPQIDTLKGQVTIIKNKVLENIDSFEEQLYYNNEALKTKRMLLNELPGVIKDLEKKKFFINKSVEEGKVENPDYRSYMNINIKILENKILLSKAREELQKLIMKNKGLDKKIKSLKKEVEVKKRIYDDTMKEIESLLEEYSASTDLRWFKKPVIQKVSLLKTGKMQNVAIAMPGSLMFAVFLSLFLEYIKINRKRYNA